MNTLNYIGSKHTLCHSIIEIIKKEIDVVKMSSSHFLDLFAGTGSIGFNMQDLVSQCKANDLEYYSYVINCALLQCAYSEKLQSILDSCNHLDGVEGLIYKNYSQNWECERMFFTSKNAGKADAIRIHIEKLKTANAITINEYYFLLASLIVSIDKVANTSCVYGAYLKEYKKTALKPLLLLPIHVKTDIKMVLNQVTNVSAEALSVKSEHYDIVYMDPPYNQRQYSANYSPLNYIAHYDESIVLKGVTGLIDGYNKSNFCSKPKVKQSFKTVLDNLKCDHIFISYNNEGLLSFEELKQLLACYGEVKVYKIQYKKFKAQKKVLEDTVYEYLWYINKTKQSEWVEEIVYSL
jgi:adenine-specific DNA-methyltransferase